MYRAFRLIEGLLYKDSREIFMKSLHRVLGTCSRYVCCIGSVPRNEILKSMITCAWNS